MEAFAIPNQCAETIAKLFVEHMVRHGVPEELLSDRGTNFFSARVCVSFLESQTDGLVEKFNSRLLNAVKLISMIGMTIFHFCFLPIGAFSL